MPKKVPMFEAKNRLPALIKEAAQGEEVLITRHGQVAAVLIGFKDEDAYFDYRLEHDLRFLARIAHARGQAERGETIRHEDIDWTKGEPKRKGKR